jgi:cytochrome b6-f complex iron-sulfur subunit
VRWPIKERGWGEVSQSANNISRHLLPSKYLAMNRREVVQKFLMGGTVLVVVPSVLESCSKDDSDPTKQDPNPPPSSLEIDLSLPANSALNTHGNSKIFSNVIVINMGSGFVALSSICTHEGCTVEYKSSGNLECPCHGSVYAISGNVLVGPAPRALRNYTVSQTGTVLTIT